MAVSHGLDGCSVGGERDGLQGGRETDDRKRGGDRGGRALVGDGLVGW